MINVPEITAQILLLDPSVPYFAGQTFLFHHRKKRFARFLSIGSRRLLPVCLWVKFVYDLLTELSGFVQQAQIEIKGNDYFLYLRMSGSHDKVAFYDLYKGRPTFGECRRPDILAIPEESVDSSEEPDGVVSRIVSKLMIDDDLKLSIV